MKKAFRLIPRRGSALLIVLGFLSFMMISAVSFAVYMRIERLASSNYRHAITARHMLNAGLFRAIDEIDSELRVERISTEPGPRPRKFPLWPGRTKPSAVVNGLDNSLNARVLNLEALSFIPGIFVHDVRRFAVSNAADRVVGVDASRGRYSYMGAKWRRLSMPVLSLAGGENAYEEAIVGRYAYVAVNLSDMLDVNRARASVRTVHTNQVGIGHLFGSGAGADARREAFDRNLRDLDISYETLQDFYACMHARNDPTFGSPFHDFITAGNNADADAGFDPEHAHNHVLIANSFALPQPVRPTACNLLLQQPISDAVLRSARPAPGDILLQDTGLQGRDGFRTALSRVFAGRSPGINLDAWLRDAAPTMIADYLDEDSIPKQLNMPSVEIVPMINQILVPDFFAPRIVSRVEQIPNSNPPRIRTVYSVQLIGDPEAAQMDVELAFPFKHVRDRANQPAFDVELKAYLRVVHTHEARNSHSFAEPPVAPNYLPLAATVAAPAFWSRDTSDPANCYDVARVVFPVAQQAVMVDIIDSEGTILTPGFTVGQPFSVALVVFARVRQGNNVVDSAPQLLPAPGMVDETSEFMATPKIFFQTVPSPPVQSAMAVNVPIPYEWHSLEIPDPRFNYNAANWLRNDERNAIVPAMNASTRALLGRDGRDGDIYLKVSNAGRLNSPGELGFILRPFSYNPMGAAADFRTRAAVDPATDDSAAYFRTIRLYDHGAPAADQLTRQRDPVYEHFTVAQPDGTAPGPRVNPLSDIPIVLEAALDRTPFDYWIASRNPDNDAALMQRNTFNVLLGNDNWRDLLNAWTQCLTNATRVSNINASLQTGLHHVYGDHNLFGWYSAGNAAQIFAPAAFSGPGLPVNLSRPLHEVDRKMLYAFSLDSFSDRQQLFLYVLRAEVTVPAFGGGQDTATQSLAGGRAIALVWRDPYPTGYDPSNNSFPRTPDWYSTNFRISPWYQVNLGRYDEQLEGFNLNDPLLVGADRRFAGFHRHRILFFKTLDN